MKMHTSPLLDQNGQIAEMCRAVRQTIGRKVHSGFTRGRPHKVSSNRSNMKDLHS